MMFAFFYNSAVCRSKKAALTILAHCCWLHQWLNDQAGEDENTVQLALFDEFLLPWRDRFLGKVESHATIVFYRTLALLTRKALERCSTRDFVEEEGR